MQEYLEKETVVDDLNKELVNKLGKDYDNVTDEIEKVSGEIEK